MRRQRIITLPAQVDGGAGSFVLPVSQFLDTVAVLAVRFLLTQNSGADERILVTVRGKGNQDQAFTAYVGIAVDTVPTQVNAWVNGPTPESQLAVAVAPWIAQGCLPSVPFYSDVEIVVEGIPAGFIAGDTIGSIVVLVEDWEDQGGED